MLTFESWAERIRRVKVWRICVESDEGKKLKCLQDSHSCRSRRKEKLQHFLCWFSLHWVNPAFKSFTSWTLIWNGRKRSQYRALEKTEFQNLVLFGWIIAFITGALRGVKLSSAALFESQVCTWLPSAQSWCLSGFGMCFGFFFLVP